MFRDGAGPAQRTPPHQDFIRSLIDPSPLLAGILIPGSGRGI